MPIIEDFLEGREPLASLLHRIGVELSEVPGKLVPDMSRRDMSHEFVWAWCQAAELFGRTQRLTGILCDLLTRDDHQAHEDLADTLQNLRDPSTVGCLFDRAIRPVEYLDSDDSAALARRCVWALHDIGTPAAISKLKLLTNDAREVVSQEASHLLEALSARRPGVTESYRGARDAHLGPL